SQSRQAIDNLMIDFNGMLYFQADDGVSGSELWRVSAGGNPAMVQDLAPGSAGSSPHAFVVFQNKLYFAAATTGNAEDIYVFDGLTTSLAAHVPVAPQYAGIKALTVFDDEIYFHYSGSIDGEKIFRFDGVSVAEVSPINESPIEWLLTDQMLHSSTFLVLQDKLYYFARSKQSTDLWAYDGTNTQKIKTVGPSSAIFVDFAIYKGMVYFSTHVSWNEKELWRYSGSGNPQKIATFSFQSDVAPRHFAVFQDSLYFEVGTDLYRFDGTILTNVSEGSKSMPFYPNKLTAFSIGALNGLYFEGYTSDLGREPYLFNGATVSLLADINPVQDPWAWTWPLSGSEPSRAVQSHDRLWFAASDGETHGRELWSIGPRENKYDCYVVVTPIWEDWRLWPVGERAVVVETHVLVPGQPDQAPMREEIRIIREQEARVKAASFDGAAPEGFALYTVVTDME
ncbi:MAG: hypothetical protein ACREQV_19905, partial [Candidatus Binatia bacterium]